LSSEESTRTSADTSLTTRVSTEESARTSADDSLASRISSEESKTGSFETRISGEESVRESADTSLDTAISNETSRAESVEGSIETRMSAFNPGSFSVITPTESVDGTNTTFTYDFSTVSGEFTIVIMLNGLVQFEGDDYTQDRGTVGLFQAVYAVAPPAGSSVKFMIWRSPVL
jgi:hypothetical protein